jgi:hypothetical protein
MWVGAFFDYQKSAFARTNLDGKLGNKVKKIKDVLPAKFHVGFSHVLFAD